jgi:hypothetical protein
MPQLVWTQTSENISIPVLPLTFMTMPLHKLLIVTACLVIALGCKSNTATPKNPFAWSRTVPPPATFSSQESYLGQSSIVLTPQSSATLFQSQPPVTQPSAPAPIPANMPLPSATPSASTEPAATLFQASTKTDATPEPEWSPANVAVTSQTAFQNLETKANTVSFQDQFGNVKTGTEMSPSAINSSGQIVTEITDKQ